MTSRQSAPVPTNLTAMSRVTQLPVGHPATELVERCLQLIAAAVSPIPRDVYTIGQVFSRASSVYEGILALIQRIESSVETDYDLNWTPFDAYTIAIPQLERFLFEFSQGYAQEKFRGHLPPIDTTANGVLYVNTWRTDREFLAKALENLKHDDLKLQGLHGELAVQLIAGCRQERQKDDQILLTALLRFLQDNKLGDGQIEKSKKVPSLSIKTMKEELANIVKGFARSPYSEVPTSIVIRTLMYFAIPCTLILSEQADNQWRIYLRKAEIWEAFYELIAHVKAYVNDPKTTDEIEKLFFHIEKLLLNLGDTAIATATEMLSLFRLAPVIYRQYSGRSAALIKTLYYLDSHSRKPELQAFASYRYELKQVMTECAQSLTALSRITLDIANFSTESVEYRNTSKEIEGLFDRAKPLFQSFGADPQLSLHESMYGQAVSTDEKHVMEARAKLFPATTA